ncbi:MAG: Na/Pi cotransporter family protein [Deltaproteobacteria bacterium]|nr:Na/Pi cotransporter family protein [Deltaproteobacteria bacterium]
MIGNLDLWKLMAGLGIFLFSMVLLEESVKALSGRAFRHMIRLYTNTRMKAIGSGTLVTAILQSSSAVSLMVLAFVGAGVMSIQNGVGVIMGSNIGTTFTAWIVATLGFKIEIESFALPFIGIGGIGLMFFRDSTKLTHTSRLLIGFGFLFLGLDYMKVSVENIAQTIDMGRIPDYGLWLYLLIGILLTAVMQASAASIAIVLTALNSQLITFEMGAAMVIGANVGTTITVLLGSIGGAPAKKRVGFSHLIFNALTAVVAFLALPILVWGIKIFFDIHTNSVMALALFHTLFNVLGVIIFLPLMGLLSQVLLRLYPDYKEILTVYIDKTPTEVPDAATAAIRKEIVHLLEECQLYNLRLLRIDEKLVFDHDLHFEKCMKKKPTLDHLYENLKLLHAEIFSFYSRLQNQKLEESEAKELERIIYASRNIMNSLKNFKSIRHNMDEFDGSDNSYLNVQYKLFRKRLVELYHVMNRIRQMKSREEQYRGLLTSFSQIEDADRQFIHETMNAVSTGQVQQMEISTLLLVNRLFTQACRLQIFSLKDILLSQEQISDFDREMDR